jgi:hypothetical protein
LPEVFVTVIDDDTMNVRVPKLRRTVATYSADRLMLVAFTVPGTRLSIVGPTEASVPVEGAGVRAIADSTATPDDAADAGDPVALASEDRAVGATEAAVAELAEAVEALDAADATADPSLRRSIPIAAARKTRQPATTNRRRGIRPTRDWRVIAAMLGGWCRSVDRR